jgi:hypothetical protein
MLNECVILRSIGGFETSYQQAAYDFDKKLIHPPGKKIRFHPDWVKDNGILENSLVRSLGINKRKASEYINDFVEDFHDQLGRLGKVHVKGIGEFALDKDNSIIFKQLDEENYLADSFGLENLPLEPVTNKAASKKQLRQQGRVRAGGKKGQTAGIVVLIILLTLIALTAYFVFSSERGNGFRNFFQSDKENGTSEKIIFGNTSEVKDTIIQSVERTLDEKTTAKQALSIRENAGGQTIAEGPTYYIVAGSFRTEKNASILKIRLQRKGFDPIVLVMGEHVRVIIGTFSNRAEALTELRRIRADLDQSVWLLTY